MLRGSEKRIIMLKNTGSPLFEEAFFIINDKADKYNGYTESEMIREANRIIESSLKSSGHFNSSSAKKGSFQRLKWYFAGAASFAAVFSLLRVLLYFFG